MDLLNILNIHSLSKECEKLAVPRILHYPGSKWSMADWIIRHMPEHKTYLEPFFGSGAVFFNKQPSGIETINDMDSSIVNLFKVIRDNPEKLVEGVLRQGHKMLMAGPSKAGKSFALIELSIAIAEEAKWLGWQCTQGKVLYVNLELNRASALHRFKDVYQALGLQPHHIWNLRG